MGHPLEMDTVVAGQNLAKKRWYKYLHLYNLYIIH